MITFLSPTSLQLPGRGPPPGECRAGDVRGLRPAQYGCDRPLELVVITNMASLLCLPKLARIIFAALCVAVSVIVGPSEAGSPCKHSVCQNSAGCCGRTSLPPTNRWAHSRAFLTHTWLSNALRLSTGDGLVPGAQAYNGLASLPLHM